MKGLHGAFAGLVCSSAARCGAQMASAKLHAWDRTSYSGGTVSLTEGIVASAGMLGAAATLPGRMRAGALTAVGAGAAAGYIDDQLEDRFPAKGKGLHGHLGALREGKLTSGALKIFVIGAGAAAGAASLTHEKGVIAAGGAWLTRTALIAGTANLVNLMDLRPGRALKVSAGLAAPLVGGPAGELATGAITTSAVCARDDLDGRTMLGDMGANALGAGLGMALAAASHPWLRVSSLGAVIGLTLASERISFSQVIEDNPVLSRIDQFGRP